MKIPIKFKTILFIIFYITSPSFSSNQPQNSDFYEPGIFNPLSEFLLKGVSDFSKRPYLIIALDKNNQILEKSLIKYNQEGRIISETILDKNNKTTGEIHYSYDKNGNIILEEFIDNKNQIIAYKKRFFNAQNQLIKIEFYENNTLSFSRIYNYHAHQITGFEQTGNNKDFFVIKLKQNQIDEIEFYQEKNIVSKIKYEYDNENKLKARIKFSNHVESRCEYEYDSSKRIKQYVFTDKIRNNWVKYKTIQFVYADQL